LTLAADVLKASEPKALYRNFSVNRWCLEATMGIEFAIRVLQFLTGLASYNKPPAESNCTRYPSVPASRYHVKAPRNSTKTACRQEQSG
jgi:hypothetical protein